MAVTADSVIVELQAKTEEYNRKMQDASSVTESALGNIGNASDKNAKKFEDGAARIANAQRNLGRQISDVGTGLAGGQSPFLILSQQLPQIIDALTDMKKPAQDADGGLDGLGDTTKEVAEKASGMGGKFGKVASFLSGPWGAALLAAGSALGVLLSKSLETGDGVDDLVDKLRENELQSRKTEEANALFGKTLEGVEKAADDAEKAIESLRRAKKGEAEQTIESIKRNLDDADSLRELTKRRLEDARALFEIDKIRATRGGPQGEARALSLSGDLERIAGLEKQLGQATEAANRLRNAYNQAVSYQTIERATESLTDSANRYYNELLDKEAKKHDASKRGQADLKRETELIEQRRAARLKEIENTERERREAERSRTGTKLAPVTLKEVTGILERKLGATIGSTTRSATRNSAVGGAKASYHLIGQGIDLPYSRGNNRNITKEQIRAVLAEHGIDIKELLGFGDKGHSDHTHVAFSRKRLTGEQAADQASRIQEQAEREAERAAQEARRNADRYADTISTLDQKIAQLSGKRLVEIEDQIASARAISDAERQQRDRAYERAVRDGELTQAQAEELKFRSQYINAMERLAISLDGQAKVRQEEFAKLQSAADVNVARLEAERDLTDSAKRKRYIDLQLIDIEEQRLLSAIELQLLDKDLSAAKRQELENQQEIIRVQSGARRAGVNESAKGPLERYRDNIRRGGSPEATQERVEELVVQELDYVRDGIANAITKKLGVKDPLLAGLLDMFIEQVIIKPIADALSKNMGSVGGGIGGGIGGVISNIFGGLFGGGRASGGHVMAGAGYLVGENGPEIFAPAQSGKIIPTGALHMVGGNSSKVVQPIIQVDARGAVMNDEFARMILSRANNTAKQYAAQAGRTAYMQSPERAGKLQSYGT